MGKRLQPFQNGTVHFSLDITLLICYSSSEETSQPGRIAKAAFRA